MNTKKNSLIITIGIVLVCIVGASLFFYHSSSSNNHTLPTRGTGGSGALMPGTLVLKGYDTVSNDSSKIRLGAFLNVGQQKNISLFLGALLFENTPQAEYYGTITPGSVDVDYTTSVIHFTVKIQKPETTYKITYNTINDDMNVFNENNQPLRPTRNPDGTVFEAPHNASRLAQ